MRLLDAWINEKVLSSQIADGNLVGGEAVDRGWGDSPPLNNMTD